MHVIHRGRSARSTVGRGARPVLVALVALLAGGGQPGSAAGETAGEPPGPCGAPIDHPGGDWPRYGHDLHNTRTQPAEQTIGVDEVADLEVAWVFDTDADLDAEGGGGEINTTPIVADGCVYLVPSSGHAVALDADTGALAWETALDVDPPGYGGGVVGAPAVDGDHLVVVVNREGSPYLAGLDRADGTVVWTTVIDEPGDSPTSITNASVQVHDGMAITGYSGSSGGTPMERGGFVIVDTVDGRLLAKTPTIPDEDFDAGYGGASIWSTAAVDVDTDHAYVGTGNPHSDRVEHDNANAIIKIDLERERPTFGEIVGVRKGNPDQYVDGLDQQPACQQLPPVYYFASFDASCAQLDLDIGAAVNLFTDEDGATMIGALQKSGVYHAAFADGMEPAWSRVLGVPCLACNASSAAYDGEQLIVAASPPGQLWGLESTGGDPRWLQPIGGPLHYFSVSAANGVVYTVDMYGYLNAYDADSGLPLAKRSFSDDAGRSGAGQGSSGVAIARNTVYAAASPGLVVAYRP